MLDPDISARDALALLSTHDAHRLDGTRDGFNRRSFLQMVGWGLGGGAVLSGLNAGVLPELLPDEWRQAFAGGPLGPTDGVLVIIGMYGGNDGLNTVIPYSNPRYYEYRNNIAIRPGTSPTTNLIPLNNDFGLHPNLSAVKALYDQQKVAIVHGLGYPNPDLSHFNSMAYWMSATVGGIPSNGWIGRWLDGIGARADLYTAGSIGSSLPLHLLGQIKRGTAIPENGFGFGGDLEPHQTRFYNGIKSYSSQSAGRGVWHDAIAGASRGQIDLAQRMAPIFKPAITSGSLAKKLTVAARLINADLGFRVLDTSLDSFDHHSRQPYEHAQKMQELNDGVAAFFATLNPTFANRVTLMTFSEFGRTPWSNDSQGTDHGTAGAHFVIGGNVKGGLYGTPPSLSSSTGGRIERWGRINATMDFRSMYATMIDGLLGGGASTVLGANYEKLDLFRPADGPVGNFPTPTPGVPEPTVPATPSGPASFVGLAPARLLDTRDGLGAIGQAATITLQVAGAGGVPTAAVAAVLNVTAVSASVMSYLTVWPADVAKPNTSSLNMAGNDVVPNLVFSKLSAGGAVNIFNFAGESHCVVDVVGYFVEGAGSRFTSLSPVRILDTREGVGAPLAAVGQGQTIDLAVVGFGGVAADADSVVLNLTVTQPTASGFITAWPAGAAKPTASNLNFVPGQTVPNLVVAKLGAGGAVSLFNSAGSTHLIADVLGSFRSADGARLIALPPARVLDTRDGGGQPVLQTPITLRVVDRGGVPASGVSGVVLNVTATGGTADGFITVYPSGEARPNASNLNTVGGMTRANLVIAKVGVDGAVSLFNSAGAQHLIADVVGYFTT